MSASAKITLPGLPRPELEALAERLLAENAALTRAVAELRAEVATLKGVKRRREVGLSPATQEAKRAASALWADGIMLRRKAAV